MERQEIIDITREYTHDLFVGCKECGLPVIDKRGFLEAHCLKFHGGRKYDDCRDLFLNMD